MNENAQSYEVRMEKTILKIQKAYLVLSILITLGSVRYLFMPLNIGEVSRYPLFLLAYVSIYFGLKRRSYWVIPWVLICSASFCFRYLIASLQPAESGIEILTKILSFILFFFFAYQISFFSKSKVRNIFNAKGRFIF